MNMYYCRILIISIFVVVFNTFYSCSAVVKSDLRLTMLGSKDPLGVGPWMDRTLKRSVDFGSSDYNDYYYHEPKELECDEDHFWHIRGLKCVPYECPGGNQYRDKHTGECTLRKYGLSDDDKNRPMRTFNRAKVPTKFRLPFGLTLKG